MKNVIGNFESSKIGNETGLPSKKQTSKLKKKK